MLLEVFERKMFAIFTILTVFYLNIVFASICATGDQKTCNAIEKGHILTEETISKILIEEESSVNFSFTNSILNFTNHFNKGNVTLHKEDILESERGFITALKNRFVELAQPFDASRSPTASKTCRLHTKGFLKGLENFDIWALKMHDSTGKLTSGILNGNINQIGDFDQCLRINAEDADNDNDSAIRGQYCLAYMQPTVHFKSKKLNDIMKLIQSHNAFKSEFNDAGHRVPRFNLINWGICVPSSCSFRDVEFAAREYINTLSENTGMDFQVRVEPGLCQASIKKPWDRNTRLAIFFFLAILSIVALSTIYEHVAASNPNDWLTSFSLKKNSKWLFNTKSSPGDIEAVHGIRFINAFMLLFAHKSMAMFFNPYNNRTEMTETLGQSWTVIGRAASLYTDPFLLFSGMLTSYCLFGRLMKGHPVNLRNEYIGRLMRIVPSLAALILFCTFVLPLMGSGPQWNLVVGHHSELCKKNWWKNLLFIHNYFGFSEMCLTHTHHLGIDTELFAVAPIAILSMWKWPKNTFKVLLGLCLYGTAARYYTSIVNELSNYVYFGTNIQRLFRTADYMYSFPPYRSTVYIMGIFLGYALRKYPNLKISDSHLKVGWVIGITCFLVSAFAPAPMGRIDYEYNSNHAAIYAAFAPIAWCLFFAWTVFVSHLGYKNQFTNFLSWKGFQVTTKLSYSLYLTQFPVFFFNVGRRRHVHHYYNFFSQMLDTNEFISIVVASITLTLLFDAPFQNLKKLIFPNRKPVTTNNSNTIPKIHES